MSSSDSHSLEIRAAAKASIALVLATFLQKGISVITVPIFTRLMTKADYGEYSVFTSWYEVVGIFTTLCLSKGVYNNGLMKFENDRERFTFSLCALSAISTLVVMTIVGIVNAAFPNLMGLRFYMVALMGVSLFGEPAYNMWRVRQRFEYRYRMQTLVSFSMAFISALFAVIAISSYRSETVLARAFGYYGVLIVYHTIFYIIHAYRSNRQINTEYWKYALRFNLPLIPHYLSLYVLNHFDRIMIDGYLGSSAAGIYTLAYQLGSVGSILWTAINASLIPYTYERCRRREYRILDRTTCAILVLYAAVCLGVILFAPEAMAILAPSSYSEATKLVPPVVGGVFFSSMYYVFANVVYYYERPRYVMIASVISASLNVALNSLFIPEFGITAAAYSTIVCYTIQAVIDYLAMKHVVGNKVYKVGRLVCIGLAVAFSAMFAANLYGNLFARIMILFSGLSIITINGKKIKRLIMSIRDAKK